MAEMIETAFPSTEAPPADGNALAGLAAELGLESLTPEEFEQLSQGLLVGEGMSLDEHYANLAPLMEDSYLVRLADDVVSWVDADESSRAPWINRVRNGIEALGLNIEAVKRQKGWMSRVTHPLIPEAVVQFVARAMAEIWPAQGPATAVVLGDPTKETMEQAVRVADYLNYLYQHDMPGAFERTEKKLLWCALTGSAFTRPYWDAVRGRLAIAVIDPHNFIVPYTATDLQTAVRYTERFWDTGVEHKQKVASGLYREVEAVERGGTRGVDGGPVQRAVDRSEGRTNILWADDVAYERYETSCFLDLPGFESEDGVPRPYTVVVDRENSQVLSIRRGWKDGQDPRFRRNLVTHHRFLPGLGFYGWGYLHTLGGLNDAATGSLRALLDSAFLSNAQGGYTSRHNKMLGKGNLEIVPGEFVGVNATPEEIKTAFFPYPFKEPSGTLMRLLPYLDESGRRFASTTEAMVGEQSPGTPVGTTLALIKQGSTVITGVQRRLHTAFTEEMRNLADLCAEWLPANDQGMYPYNVAGQSRAVFVTDFDERIDVIPAADPEMSTEGARMAQAQGILQLATQFPQYHNLRAALERMYQAMKVTKYDTILQGESEPQPTDPVSEGVALLRGEPAKAFPDQDHVAHMAIHVELLKALDKETLKEMEPKIRAHLAEHMGLYYQQQMLQKSQVPMEMLGQPGVEQIMAQVRVNALLPFPDDAAEEIKDYSTLKKEMRRDIELQGKLERERMKAENLVDVQQQQQALGLAGQKLQNEETLRFAQMMHELDVLKKQVEILQKRGGVNEV